MSSRCDRVRSDCGCIIRRAPRYGSSWLVQLSSLGRAKDGTHLARSCPRERPEKRRECRRDSESPDQAPFKENKPPLTANTRRGFSPRRRPRVNPNASCERPQAIRCLRAIAQVVILEIVPKPQELASCSDAVPLATS